MYATLKKSLKITTIIKIEFGESGCTRKRVHQCESHAHMVSCLLSYEEVKRK